MYKKKHAFTHFIHSPFSVFTRCAKITAKGIEGNYGQGVYIMQNTMVGGGGVVAGEKNEK